MRFLSKTSYINTVKKQRRPTKPYSITEFKLYAKSKGGECLSDNFYTIHDKLRWRCKEGHIWDAKIRIRDKKNSSWCKKCADKQSSGQYHKLSLIDCVKISKKYGGICLSPNYINARTKLQWKCKENHEFSKTYDKVSQGHWCPQCNYHKSTTEKIIRQVFEFIFKKKFPTVKPSWLLNKEGNRLELDGFNEELNLA